MTPTNSSIRIPTRGCDVEHVFKIVDKVIGNGEAKNTAASNSNRSACCTINSCSMCNPCKIATSLEGLCPTKNPTSANVNNRCNVLRFFSPQRWSSITFFRSTLFFTTTVVLVADAVVKECVCDDGNCIERLL